MSDFTCINCSVRFANADIQRLHYKTDWHRYNLKRKVAALPPVTAEEFQKRVLQQRSAEENALQENEVVLYCNTCRKNFGSENAYHNHLNSKKHKECVEASVNSGDVTVLNKIEQKVVIEDDDNMDDLDSEEWEDLADNPIDNNDCVFCNHHSDDFVENMKHMCITHSFFVPDADYCIDVRELMVYLGEKITKGKQKYVMYNYLHNFMFIIFQI